AYAHDGARYGSGLTDALAVPRDGHEIDRMMALLAPLGVAPPARARDPEYILPASGAAFAREWLAAHGLAPGRYGVIGLGARRAKKQPDTGQTLRWSARLLREHDLRT